MKLLSLFCLFFVIAILIIQNHLLLALLAVLLFSYYTDTIWLLPLGFFLDGYFGTFAIIPWFAIAAIGWYVVVEFLRPRLYNQTIRV